MTDNSGHGPKSVTFKRKLRSRSPGTTGHVPPEQPVTLVRNRRSRCPGILISSATKDRLGTLAAKRQLSESALLKDLLEITLGGPAVPASDDAEPVARLARGARLYVRLRPDDQLLLAERAAARRMAAATYVSVLVRAHLRHLAPLPHDELRALNRVVAELGAIGRNLNQIARATHQGAPATGPHRGDVLAMLKVCEALRDHVKALLKDNAVSWKVGYAEPIP